MVILGIDTSALAAGAAVLRDGKLISETYINTGLTHSQTLLTLIDTALSNVDLSLNDVDGIAVSVGPGSFTGIRIGVSAVKGLCFSDNKKCFAVSTLEAMANSVDIDGFLICPVMDARCKQVYTALFEKISGEIQRVWEDSPMALAELADKLPQYNKKIVLIGDGADIAYDFLIEKGLDVRKFSEIFKYQHASGVAITALRQYNKTNEFLSADDIMPVYLRLSQAERELKNRS